jgi:DNA polymerase I-like protein with 3'-5' exonuclease and polymerase domains
MVTLRTPETTYTDLKAAPFVVLDTEYDPETKRVYQVGLYGPGTLVWIWDEDDPKACSREAMLRFVQRLSHEMTIVVQHAPADLPVMGIDFDTAYRIEDTVLADSALWSEWQHNLRFLISRYGKHERVKQLGPGSWEYLRGDVVETANVWMELSKELDADPLTKNVYERYLRPLTPVIINANRRDIRVHTEQVEEYDRLYTMKIRDAERIAEAYVGYPINLDGPQLVTYLTTVEDVFAETKIRTKKTKGGNVAFDKDVVAALRDAYLPRDDDEELSIENVLSRMQRGGHPLLEARAFFIESRQRHSSYIAPLLGRSRICPTFLPFAQATGRWSTIDPPLAQLPSDLRHIIRPDDGEAWVEFDWNNIEAFIMAYESNDPILLDALTNGYDLHTINVCDLFGYPYPPNLRDPHTCVHLEFSNVCDNCRWRVTHKWEGKDDVRRVFAKRFMFRLFYGGKPEGAPSIPGADLLAAFGLDKKALVHAAHQWVRKHPKITQYWKTIEYEATHKGIVRTAFGRRRVLFEWDFARRIRQAYDEPMQGAVSDIMNKTIIDLWRVTHRVGGRLIYTMHDSIKWGIPAHLVDEYLPIIKEIVEQEWNFRERKVRFAATYYVRYV